MVFVLSCPRASPVACCRPAQCAARTIRGCRSSTAFVALPRFGSQNLPNRGRNIWRVPLRVGDDLLCRSTSQPVRKFSNLRFEHCSLQLGQRVEIVRGQLFGLHDLRLRASPPISCATSARRSCPTGGSAGLVLQMQGFRDSAPLGHSSHGATVTK